MQLDWAKAHQLPDFHVGDNVKAWAGLEDSFWTYRASLAEAPPLAPGEELFLVLEGIDYEAEVFVGAARVAQQTGLQGRIEVKLAAPLRAEAQVTVRLSPAPKSRPEPQDRSQANHSVKPAVSYGWDFHPRLIPLGLWRPAYLEVRPAVHFAVRPALEYTLDDSLSTVQGRLAVALSAPCAGDGLNVRWSCRAPDGTEAVAASAPLGAGMAGIALPFALERPVLWWPHDQGEPALYAHTVELVGADGRVLDRAQFRTGFRRVRVVMAPDQWKQPVEFPKSRSLPPVTLEVNGRRLFVKGTNWVCPDVFPGRVTRERYARQLALVKSANLALVRMWGGAVAPQDEFYDLCDEMGLMVWQEFPLACNQYPDDPAYLEILDQESRHLIRRLQGHPAVVLWCGGNELFNFWSGMTEQSLALRLLNRNCYDLDPSRPFFATAPLEGMGHGHYVFRDPVSGRECWDYFQQSQHTAYSEFGGPGPASAARLREIIPDAEIWPPRPGTAWETHHAFNAWLPTAWLYLDTIEYYFGPVATLEDLVRHAQLLQGVGLQGLYEEARRQKPVASLAMNWCFNEPWSTAANNSLVQWPDEPKPALAWVRQACRPTLVSARIGKFSWSPGEAFGGELWLLHDASVALSDHTVTAELVLEGRIVPLTTWSFEAVAPAVNLRGPKWDVVLPDELPVQFEVRVRVLNKPEWDSSYVLVRAREDRPAAGAPVTVRTGTMNF